MLFNFPFVLLRYLIKNISCDVREKPFRLNIEWPIYIFPCVRDCLCEYRLKVYDILILTSIIKHSLCILELPLLNILNRTSVGVNTQKIEHFMKYDNRHIYISLQKRSATFTEHSNMIRLFVNIDNEQKYPIYNGNSFWHGHIPIGPCFWLFWFIGSKPDICMR